MNKKDRKDNYIQFPLCLLRETYEDPEAGLNLIFSFGIVHFAKTFKYVLYEVARQLMYSYYRQKGMIQGDLFKAMEQYINDGKICIDEDYFGFTGLNPKSFDPTQSIYELLQIFTDDTSFKEAAILSYQIKQAKDALDLTITNVDYGIGRYNKAKALQADFESKFGADAMPMIKPKHLFEFRKSLKDIDIFRSYVAIRSLIGYNTFGKSNKPAILSRMIGCKSKAAFEHFTTDPKQKKKHIMPIVEKYSKRYHMDKLLFTLAERKFIMFLSKQGTRDIYLSTYMEPEQLGQLIKDKKSTRDLKKRMKEVTATL